MAVKVIDRNACIKSVSYQPDWLDEVKPGGCMKIWRNPDKNKDEMEDCQIKIFLNKRMQKRTGDEENKISIRNVGLWG